ncbi:MAG: SUKH-3 domain-containing protein [Oscillospiraceae bacterium]|nr:SUKH-3 domain-containing protein [Oscillospiraceae bacterium]
MPPSENFEILLKWGDFITKQDFLEFASKEIKYGFRSEYNLDKLDKKLHQLYPQPFDSRKMLEYYQSIGFFELWRTEKYSVDVLYFDLRFLELSSLKNVIYIEQPCESVSFWKDIGSVVASAAAIENSAGTIEYIFISEKGEFYNDQHRLIADSLEKFFDYIANVEYDYHPIIGKRIYDFLTAAGWYKGRTDDVSSVYKAFHEKGIELTQIQLDFIAEFNGLHFYFDDDYVEVEFFDLKTLIEGYHDFNKEIQCIGNRLYKNAIKVGHRFMIGDVYLESEGILLNEGYSPMGRTTMECIKRLFDCVPERCKLRT